MKSRIRSQSRWKTPWDTLSKAEITPMQKYLRDLYKSGYDSHHKSLAEMNDVDLFDSYYPESCPYCQSEEFVRDGFYKTGLQRYTCRHCRKTFCITTGTVFEDHKISVGEWIWLQI
jgi:hypothetical protein